MKKISLPILLLGIVVLPILILYLADKNGAITNPVEDESEFVNTISPEIFKSLTDDEKKTLSERFNLNAINLLDEQDVMRPKNYKNGSFVCEFYNDVNQNRDWYEFSFGKQSNETYYSFKLRTGLYEKLSILKHTDTDEIILFRNYIPLLHNRFNTLQVNIIDGHILILLNRKISFHLLLEANSTQGGISFESSKNDIHFIRQARYSPIPEHRRIKNKSIIDKIPFILLRN